MPIAEMIASDMDLLRQPSSGLPGPGMGIALEIPMISIELRKAREKETTIIELPIDAQDLMEARKLYRQWIRRNPHNPLDGAWGVHVEYGFIRPNVPWFCALSDFDRILALHAIVDRFCRIA